MENNDNYCIVTEVKSQLRSFTKSRRWEHEKWLCYVRCLGQKFKSDFFRVWQGRNDMSQSLNPRRFSIGVQIKFLFVRLRLYFAFSSCILTRAKKFLVWSFLGTNCTYRIFSNQKFLLWSFYGCKYIHIWFLYGLQDAGTPMLGTLIKLIHCLSSKRFNHL